MREKILEKIESIELNPYFLIFMGIVLYGQYAWVPGLHNDGLIYATLGKNAALNGHWLVPHLSEFTMPEFHDHPPFYFMLEGLWFKLFGVSWTAARIFGITFPLLCLWACYHFMKSIDRNWAFVTTMILCLTMQFIKKGRFPNLDFPLTFSFIFSLYSYYRATLNPSWPNWLAAGAFFGLGLLFKGPAACFIGLIVLVHLIVSKQGHQLKTIKPYCAVILGFAIFSLWPIILAANGQYHIFERWLNQQVLGTIVSGRNQIRNVPWGHILYLFQWAGPWLILAFYSHYSMAKRKLGRNHPYWFMVVWFYSLLIPLSLMKWKYSHYLMPLYMPLAAMAAYQICMQSKLVVKSFVGFFKTLVIIGSLALLLLPLTNKTRRQRELQSFYQLTQYFHEKPLRFYNLNNAMDRWSFTPWVTFATDATPIDIDLNSFQENMLSGRQVTHRSVTLVTDIDYKFLRFKYPNLLRHQIKRIMTFPHMNLSILVSKDLLPLEDSGFKLPR